MAIVTHSYAFDVQNGVAGTFRRWVGTITWTRDLETQIVEMRIQATKEGTSNSGLYIYWVPNIPVELRIESDQYPRTDHGDMWLAVTGEGYVYIYGAVAAPGTIDETYRYLTDQPIVEDVPAPTDSLLRDINARIEALGVAAYEGYAPTGAALPYVVSRPLLVDSFEELAINGDAVGWDFNVATYCCAAGVEASFNLALAVMGTLQGAWMRGTTLAASMGYNGAEVEGHYESQVTVQLNQGGI